MNGRTVILTADDYGLCPSVNRAIEEGAAHGALTSTNVMVNMPDAGEAAAFRTRFPLVSLGLHWTLCQGRPVLPADRVPTLVDRQGHFLSAASFRGAWRAGRVAPDQLRAELEAQHQRFVALAGPPDYWNTHENTHVYPGLFPLFVEAALACGIRRMRSHRRLVIPKKGTPAQHAAAHFLFWFKGRVIDWYSGRAERLGTWMPRGLVYAPGYDKPSEIEAILTSPWMPEGTGPSEFVVHPSTRPHPELFGALVDSRIQEYRTLTAPGLLARLHEQGVRLVSFGRHSHD